MSRSQLSKQRGHSRAHTHTHARARVLKKTHTHTHLSHTHTQTQTHPCTHTCTHAHTAHPTCLNLKPFCPPGSSRNAADLIIVQGIPSLFMAASSSSACCLALALNSPAKPPGLLKAANCTSVRTVTCAYNIAAQLGIKKFVIVKTFIKPETKRQYALFLSLHLYQQELLPGKKLASDN